MIIITIMILGDDYNCRKLPYPWRIRMYAIYGLPFTINIMATPD